VQHWDYYWQKTKTLNSFAEGEQGLGYAGEIAAFWQTIFANLNDSARVLDLATGNGGLAVLALQYNECFVVSASDKANIAPLKLFTSQDKSFSLLQKIKFHGNMPSEALTFDDDEFEIVISQFGFEYSRPEKSLQQLHRILKPQGKLVALVHQADSFISEDCSAGLKVLQAFLSQEGLLAKAKIFAKCCEQLQRFEALSAEQQALLKQQSDQLLASFAVLQRSCKAEELDWFNLLAKDLVQLLGSWRRLSVEQIELLSVNLHHFRQRIADQVAASWDFDQIEKIKNTAQMLGFSVSYSSLDSKNGKLCWVFIAQK
jgi:ubiquinone/menaquinone biosynthesis C-methylase UbiE